MAMDRINRKLDLIMEKLGVDTSEFEPKPVPARKLTAAEQQAIDNAPKTPVAEPPAVPRRTTETGAPSTASSVPAASMPWPDYDDLNVGQVVSRARTTGADLAMRNRILAYERAHKNRDGIIQPMVNWNS